MWGARLKYFGCTVPLIRNPNVAADRLVPSTAEVLGNRCGVELSRVRPLKFIVLLRMGRALNELK